MHGSNSYYSEILYKQRVCNYIGVYYFTLKLLLMCSVMIVVCVCTYAVGVVYVHALTHIGPPSISPPSPYLSPNPPPPPPSLSLPLPPVLPLDPPQASLYRVSRNLSRVLPQIDRRGL